MPMDGMRAPPRKVGRYALHGEIASGGMATVHFGRLLGPVGFSRTVAIKRLHPAFATDPEFVSMFLDEARLAARIRHPNVVPTLDVVATGGELFLVMDYVQGESLARLWRALRERRERIPPPIVASIMSGCLQGLHAAHEARDERGMSLGIVHRDVSPQNILVAVDGLARVLDFGVAKAAGRLQTTREGQLKGKLAYMAPEQLHHDEVTRQVDVYAAAVVLWESLTGERLFKAETEAMVVARLLEGKVRPPSQVTYGVPKAFDEVTARGLAKDPSARFKTAREMSQALERCGPVASIAEVAEWLERVAGGALEERAKKVAAIEGSDNNSIPDIAAAVAQLHGEASRRLRTTEPTAKKLLESEPPRIDSTRPGIGPDAPTMPESFQPLDPPTLPNSILLDTPPPMRRAAPKLQEPGPVSQLSSVSVSADKRSLSGLTARASTARVAILAAVAVCVLLVAAFAVGRGTSAPSTASAPTESAPPPSPSPSAMTPAAIPSPEPAPEPVSPPAVASDAHPAIDAGAHVGRPAAPVGGRPSPARKPGGTSAFDRIGGRD